MKTLYLLAGAAALATGGLANAQQMNSSAQLGGSAATSMPQTAAPSPVDQTMTPAMPQPSAEGAMTTTGSGEVSDMVAMSGSATSSVATTPSAAPMSNDPAAAASANASMSAQAAQPMKRYPTCTKQIQDSCRNPGGK